MLRRRRDRVEEFEYRAGRKWGTLSRTREPMHFVYIVRCRDGSLYTGYARDPSAREKIHNAGKGARYTSGRRPVTLVYAEAFESHGDALKREHELKRWSRTRKQALIALQPRLTMFTS